MYECHKAPKSTLVIKKYAIAEKVITIVGKLFYSSYFQLFRGDF